MYIQSAISLFLAVPFLSKVEVVFDFSFNALVVLEKVFSDVEGIIVDTFIESNPVELVDVVTIIDALDFVGVVVIELLVVLNTLCSKI